MAQYDDSASEAYTSDARSLVQRSTSDQFFNNSTTIPEHSVPSGDPSHQFTDDAGNFFVRQAVRPRRTRIGAFFGPELLDACVEIGPLNPNGDEYVIVVESDELLDVDSYQGRSRCYFNIKNITALDAQHRSVRIEFDSGHARFLCLEFASRLDSEMYSFVAALAAVLNTQRAPQELQQLEHDVLPNWCDFIPDVVYSKAARLYGQRAMNVWTVFSVVWALYQLHKVLGISIREHIQYILLNYLYFGHFFQAINAYMADILESWDAFIVSIALLLNTFYDTFLRIPHLMLRNFRPLFNAIGSFFGVLTQHFASLFKVFSPLWTVISRNWTVFYNAASASFTPMMTLARNFGTNMAAPLAAFRAARVAAAEASAAGAAATDVAQSIGYYRATVDALWSAISAPLKLVVAAFWATVRFVQLARDKWAEKTQREYGARMSECTINFTIYI